jgi:hypothetical protein
MKDIKPEDLDPPLMPDEDPCASIIGKRISQMNDEEVEEHVKKVRAARESPQILRALLAAKKPRAKSSAPAKKPDLSVFGL